MEHLRLKQTVLRISAALAMLYVFSITATAGVPSRINYQGRLKQNGLPVNGTQMMTFQITNSGGAEYWGSGSVPVVVSSGLFNYVLTGTGDNLNGDLSQLNWATMTPYIQVTVGSQVLGPLEQMNASAYSMYSTSSTASFNLVGGVVGSIPYQSASGITAMLAPSAGYHLRSTAAGPAWSTILYDNGSVGIGTTGPESPLAIGNSLRSTSDFSSWAVPQQFEINNVYNAASGVNLTMGIYAQAGPLSISSSDIALAIDNEIPSTQGGNYAGTKVGLFAETRDAGGGTVNALEGALLEGVYSGGATATSVMGSYDVSMNNGAGTITNSYGVQGYAENTGAGTITNAYGVYGKVTMTAGTITNAYGVYITTAGTTGGTFTNTPYDLYAADGGSFNYFAGNVGIGITNPGYKLDVSGNANISGALTAGTFSPATLAVPGYAYLAYTSGNVGIGTVGPGQKLEVDGTSVGSGAAQTNISAYAANGIRMTGTGANSQDGIMYQSGGSGGGAGIAFRRGGGWDTYIDFYTNNASPTGGISQAMTINNLGNVSVTGSVSASSFSGAGTGLTGTAAGLTAGAANAVTWGNVSGKPTTIAGYGITDVNSYAPTLINGVGASGTWGISITGTAANISAYTINQNVGTANSPTFAGLSVNGVMGGGGNYYNVLSYNLNGTPTNGFKITTNIPYTNGSQMPTIIIEGYDYGDGAPIGIALTWYVYNGAFNSYKATSWGNIAPTILLAENGSGYVTIFLNFKPYFARFSVRAYAYGMSETSSWFNGWSAADAAADSTNQVTVPYSNTFGAVNASSFSGAGTGLTGTASGLTAGAANAVAWGNVSSKPTTIAGYGITDVNSYAPTLINGVGASGTWGINISGTAAAASSVAWGNVSGKPTTIGGYGITDVNSYAPTLINGVGASGTWGISITGTASNISAYTINQNVGTSNSPTFAGLNLYGAGGENIGNGTSNIWLGNSGGSNYLESGNTAWTASANMVITGYSSNNIPTLYLQATNVTFNGAVTGMTSLGVTGTVTAGTFSGSGSGLTGVAWGNVSGKPTTIGGYGITDVNSYAPTLINGVGASGTWGISISGNAATVGGLSVNGTTNNAANEIVRTDVNGYANFGWINTISGDNGTTGITRVYASNDNYLRTYTLANFTSQIQSTASGTWGINVTGSAGSASTAGTATSATYMSFQSATGNWVNDFNSVSPAQRGWAQQSSGGPAGTWWFMENMRHSNGTNYWGTQLAWGWEDNANQLYQRNVSGGSWSGWVRYLNSGNFNSYAPTLTGTGAYGTWGINISGTAAAASSVAWGNVSGKPTTIGGYGITDVNSYAPTLINGVGASGTWGISITGTASNISAYTINQNIGTSNAPTFAGLTVSGKGQINNVFIGGPPAGGTPDYGAYADSVIGGVNLWLGSRSGGNLYLNGQSGGGNVYILPNGGGNVGIGTTGPGALLHVVSTVGTGMQAVTAGTRIISEAGSGNNYMEFRNTADNTSQQGLLFVDNNLGGYVVFQNYLGDNLYLGGYNNVYIQAGSGNTVAAKTTVATFQSNGNASITGALSASSFSGSGSGLTGTASSLTAGAANSVAWGNVSSKPTTIGGYGITDVNSYAPTLGGTGASGTWSINVTGTAGSISGYNNPTTAATANTIVYRDGSANISGGYIFGSYFNASAGNSENPSIGQIWTQNTSDNYLRKSTPASFISQLGLITTGNYNSYSPTLTGGNASGTWGINITGSASSAGNVAWSAISGVPSTVYASGNRPGPTGLYRREDDSGYNVQTYWTGAYWHLDGYSGNSYHAGCQVAYADNAGSAGSLNGYTMNQSLTTGNDPTFDSVYTANWFRSNGNSGWYNQSYAVGVYATQAGRVDLYNGAGLYVPGALIATNTGNQVYAVYAP